MSGTLTLEPDAIRTAVGGLTFRTKAFIDGAFVDAASERTYRVENPANGGTLAHVAECDATDVDRAVAAARRAADSGTWSGMAPGDRKRILVRFADLIDAHTEELALIESLDVGKPISDTRALEAAGVPTVQPVRA